MKMNCNLRDSNVKAVQNMLISKGYSVGMCGADGYFGENTFEALKRFQSNNGLMVDGIVGINTWNRLFE